LTRLTDEPNKVVGRVKGHAAHPALLVAAGIPLKVVGERLGHSTITLTVNTCAPVTAKTQEDAVQKLDGAFRGIR
jgi:hypothetical protein